VIELKIKMRQEEEEKEKKRLAEKEKLKNQSLNTQQNSKLVLETSTVQSQPSNNGSLTTNKQTNPQNDSQQERPRSNIPQHWQDYIPENIAMDLQNQNVDYDAIMLNEAIKRSLGNSGTPL
jgi:hypothetical protein